MEIALNSSAIGISPSSTTATKSSILSGLQPSQSLPIGWVQGDCLYASGGVFKNDHSNASKKGLALLASLALSGTAGILPTTNTATPSPTTPNHCSIISFNSSSLTSNTVTNNMKPSTAITDSAIITSSSNASTSTIGVEAAILKCNKKSLSSATKLTTNSNSANSSKSVVGISTAATASFSVGKHYFQIPSDILDDLASRFIINVPDMELSNLIRICFQIELAHWFYLDFFSAIEDKKLQPCGIKPFAMQIFQHIPFLREHLSSIDKILDDWKNYKLSVPTYGAILISEDLKFCLLVQSYFAKSSWGFPKGKVNENEDPVHCATREVYEETGYDITELIVPNDYIEAVINYQYTRLYIVRNVSLQTQFSPRTRNEIKCCDWFPIDSLPINKNDAISKTKLGLNANSFFMIMPFVKRLKKWVNDKRSGIESRCKCTGSAGGIATAVCGQPTHPLRPLSTSPVITHPVGLNQKNSFSTKKNNKQQHQQNNDDSIALKNGSVTGGSGAGSVTVGRSRRQRHKSMGDLDGVKLTNITNNTSSNNCKATSNKNNNNGVGKIGPDHSTNGCSGPSNAANGVSGNNQKRNSAKCLGTSGSNNNGNGPPKRQLFHSQSQSGTQNLDKNGSTFDFVRKEKTQQHQLKIEKQSKAQKQQQQPTPLGSTRVRAKSQSDKMAIQNQQQQINNKTNNNGNNNINNNGGSSNNSKQRLQKQQSMIITKISNNRAIDRFTPSPAFGTAPIVATPSANGQPPKTINNSYAEGKNITTKTANATTGTTLARPRPASVSPQNAPVSLSSSPPKPQLLHRMASGTNLRTLKRANSQQQKQELQRRQRQQTQQPLKFTPSFNSWTNFSFTKNFIANVFC